MCSFRPLQYILPGHCSLHTLVFRTMADRGADPRNSHSGRQVYPLQAPREDVKYGAVNSVMANMRPA